MLGVVSAKPRYTLSCKLHRHEKALFPWAGLSLPYCVTCLREKR